MEQLNSNLRIWWEAKCFKKESQYLLNVFTLQIKDKEISNQMAE